MVNKNFILKGRKNEIFKSSGIKIFPENIKNEILNIKGITNAFVFPKYFELFGNAPVAAYELLKPLLPLYFFRFLYFSSKFKFELNFSISLKVILI